MDLSSVQLAKGAKPTANKIVVVGEAGTFKTTFGAYAPDPIFVSALGEGSGITKLAEAKSIPQHVAWLPEITDKNQVEGDGWITFLHTLAMLLKEKHKYKTVVIDCFDDEGFLDLAYHHHCNEAYGGNMGTGKNGFMNYQQGYGTCLDEIKRATHGAMNMLAKRGIDVILLMHATTTIFKNPDGFDYNRHTPNVNKQVWPMIRGWADMVLYATYQTAAIGGDDDGKGAKGIGGSQRVIYCNHSATHDAKNRHGLPDMIVLPDDPALVYKTFVSAIGTKGKSNSTPSTEGDN